MERVIEVDEPEESLPSDLTTLPTNDFSRKRVAGLACEQLRFRPRLMRPPTRRRTRREYSHTDIITSTFEISVNSQLQSRRSMEGSDVSSSSAITVVTSATSSSDPWSSSGFVEEEGGEDTDVSWGHDDDNLVAPKLEPMDDEVFMEDVKESTVTPIASSTPVPLKRRRGRPRKHPIPTPETMAKVSKGRSKTGCITCRKRKKKCDEAKPHCMNCEKNAVVCEGYPDKTIWKSGKEKAEEARLRRVSLPNIRLEPVIHGVETTGDKMFFEHYIFRLSTIFTVEGETKNAFKDMLLPLAVQHLGLMHSILALSSRHIDYRSPYGMRLLEDNPDVDVETLQKRSQFHHDSAMKELHSDIERQDRGDKDNVVISAIFGQMLCLVLQTLADPSPCGEHRVHLQAYKNLIQHSPPEDGPFLEFIQEFFQYHIGLDELISFPPERADLGAADEEWNTPATMVPTDAVRLLGVVDGLFLYMSKITNIRNKIRQNMKHGLDPVVDYTSLYRASEIDAWIRAWRPAWPPGDARDLAGLLYKQMIWVYLWRTIYPPKSTTWRPDPRIIQAVNDGIVLLGRFSPRDPSQTLILAPAFVIGCAAFEKGQRDQIRKAIGVVKAYMEYKNTDTALEVLEEVWRLMDVKDEASWDWQSIAHGMGMDFLPT